MTDTKQKCQGCGAETMSDVGWCLACRSILYTNLEIAKSDFRQTEFKTMVFPVRDVLWLQERLRLRDAEIKAMDTVNDEMVATILGLRADLAEARAALEAAPTATLRQQLAGSQSALSKVMGELAEARADVQRFEAALDTSQRELAQARAICNAQAEVLVKSTQEFARAEHSYRTMAKAAALADAERVRDEARKQRDFAKYGEDNMRFLKVLWENECGFYRAQSVARLNEIDMSRRTIRALVVAFRDALHLTRRVASDETWNLWLQLVQRQASERRESERNHTTHD